MSQYRYVGTYSEIIDTPFKFTRYGQLVEIPDDVAQRAIEEGCHLLPAAEFDKLGHTAEELKKYGSVAMHFKAPPEFIEKRNAAWAKFSRTQEIPPPVEAHDKPLLTFPPVAQIEPVAAKSDALALV